MTVLRPKLFLVNFGSRALGLLNSIDLSVEYGVVPLFQFDKVKFFFGFLIGEARDVEIVELSGSEYFTIFSQRRLADFFIG